MAARAKKNENPLGELDGRDVLATTIKLVGAGDGLSAPLKIDPQVMHIGEKVYIVAECEVQGLGIKPIKDTDCVTRIHELRVNTTAIVEEDDVRTLLDAQREKQKLARESAEGIQRLNFDKENMRGDHVLGEHDGHAMPGCELCEEQDAAVHDAHPDDWDAEDEELAQGQGNPEPAEA